MARVSARSTSIWPGTSSTLICQAVCSSATQTEIVQTKEGASGTYLRRDGPRRTLELHPINDLKPLGQDRGMEHKAVETETS